MGFLGLWVKGIKRILQVARGLPGVIWLLGGLDGGAPAIVDIDGKNADIGISVNSEFSSVRVGQSLQVNTSTLDVWGWGSSSMERMAEQLRDMTRTIDSRANYHDGGSGGEFSTHIAARLGAVPFLVSISAGVIPSEGAVAVQVSNALPTKRLLAFNGWLNGVYGKMSSSATSFKFTRAEAGASVIVPDGTPFIPDDGLMRRSDITLLWMGKNDIPTYSARDIITRTDASVKWVTLYTKQCLVLGHFHDSNMAPDCREARILDKVNAAYEARYGALYVDVQRWMTSPQIWIDTGIAPTALDLIQQSNKQKPHTLSSDNGHFSASVYPALVHNVLLPKIRQLQWC